MNKLYVICFIIPCRVFLFMTSAAYFGVYHSAAYALEGLCQLGTGVVGDTFGGDGFGGALLLGGHAFGGDFGPQSTQRSKVYRRAAR